MVLVDSSVWIEYFKGNESTLPLNELIDSNNLCINDLILSELLPSINQKNENDLKELLLTITKIELEIDWHQIIAMQTLNLKNGINKVGIADLIIAQNAIENDLELFAFDKHFILMSVLHDLRIFRR
jgi:predicted nucleic acid-binding protein